MAKRVDLPNDQWAQILSGDEVPEGKSRQIDAARLRLFKASNVDLGDLSVDEAATDAEAAASKVRISAESAAASMEFMPDLKDAIILAHLKQWSYEASPDGAGLLEIPRKAYEALYEACAEEMKSIHPDMGPAGAADAASPTEPLAE